MLTNLPRSDERARWSCFNGFCRFGALAMNDGQLKNAAQIGAVLISLDDDQIKILKASAGPNPDFTGQLARFANAKMEFNKTLDLFTKLAGCPVLAAA